MLATLDPLAPIAMLGNALGVEDADAGVPLHRNGCRRSAAFWEHNAHWRS